MFHLVRILNGRINVPEPQRIALKTTTDAQCGDLVLITNGNATIITNLSPVLPTHYVFAKKSDTELLAAAVTPEMVFETTVSDSPASMTVGNEYLLSEDGKGIGIATAASGKRGATLHDKLDAQKQGDSVLVRFL